MDPEKIGKFIKELRLKNNLTQKDLADKYNVTYQAVSKWENGINIPDISLLKEMSKDFNISIDNILDGKLSNKKNNKKIIYITIFIILFIIMIISILIIFNHKEDNNFNFKTLSTTCEEFKVYGSIAYDKEKSSIYISNINYCGGNDTIVYKEITCNLYEKTNDSIKIISTSKSKNNIKLEDYLKELELNIDNYNQTCKNYTNDSLFLEINAKDNNNKIITYKIPLSLNDNCSK